VEGSGSSRRTREPPSFRRAFTAGKIKGVNVKPVPARRGSFVALEPAADFLEDHQGGSAVLASTAQRIRNVSGKIYNRLGEERISCIFENPPQFRRPHGKRPARRGFPEVLVDLLVEESPME
jgi:hypothetical protein